MLLVNLVLLHKENNKINKQQKIQQRILHRSVHVERSSLYRVFIVEALDLNMTDIIRLCHFCFR